MPSANPEERSRIFAPATCLGRHRKLLFGAWYFPSHPLIGHALGMAHSSSSNAAM
jgi:hypothetical protein